MMPVLRVSDAVFDDLRQLSKWWETESPAKTLEQAVIYAMNNLGLERDLDRSLQEEEVSVAFSTVTAAQVDGRPIRKKNWGQIMLEVVSAVHRRTNGERELVQALNINSKIGQYTERGYKYYPNLGISIQGQSAPDAWKEASRLAKRWSIPVRVDFEWSDNPKAQRPGQNFSISIG